MVQRKYMYIIRVYNTLHQKLQGRRIKLTFVYNLSDILKL